MKNRSREKTVLSVFGILLVLLATASCASYKAPVDTYGQAPFIPAEQPQEYVIRSGDQLDIKFFYNPELNETVTVRPDGKISLQLIDDVQAAGRRPTELDGILTQQYAQEVKKPKITVIVRSFTAHRVLVDGEVNRPSVLNLTEGMTALEAVINAGGLKETAKPEAAIIVRKGKDNRPVPLSVDLRGAMYGEGGPSNLALEPHDIVYVPKTAIAKANKWVNQYIEQLLLIRGASLGFTYELKDDN